MTRAAPPQVSFHTATRRDVHQMMKWAEQEGWNPGLDDASAFWQADQTGFFVARVGDEMVAAISVVNHDDRMAFLGLYLCRLAFRGKGIGFALWTHALEHAGSRCVGLDGVAAQEANYAKSGFVRQGAIMRWQGQLPNPELRRARAFNEPCDYGSLAELDRQAIGYKRPKFLSQWLRCDVPSRKTVVLEEAGLVTGFATARQCAEGVKIGPIIAQNDKDTVQLLFAAGSLFKAQQIIVDLPDTQTEFTERLRDLGFVPTFETAHMFRGSAPQATQAYRAVATMECG